MSAKSHYLQKHILQIAAAGLIYRIASVGLMLLKIYFPYEYYLDHDHLKHYDSRYIPTKLPFQNLK